MDDCECIGDCRRRGKCVCVCPQVCTWCWWLLLCMTIRKVTRKEGEETREGEMRRRRQQQLTHTQKVTVACHKCEYIHSKMYIYLGKEKKKANMQPLFRVNRFASIVALMMLETGDCIHCAHLMRREETVFRCLLSPCCFSGNKWTRSTVSSSSASVCLSLSPPRIYLSSAERQWERHRRRKYLNFVKEPGHR